MNKKLENIVQIILQELSIKGFDILELFSINTYNKTVEIDHQIPSVNNKNNLAILVGNTKKFWNNFVNELKVSPSRIDTENPFDDFVVENIEEVRKLVSEEIRIRYSHRPEPKHIAFQKLASVVNLAYLSPAHLSIHPKFGAWFSLRAVIVLPIVNDNLPLLPPVNSCTFCSTKCTPIFNLAISKGTEALPNSKEIKSNWKNWLAVRDSCPIGKEYRFSEEQIEYHYTKNRSILRNLIQI